MTIEKSLKEFTPLYSFEQSKIEDIWKWAANKSFMTKIDAIKAFHAVPISQQDYKYYKFMTTKGIYSYKVLPMGTWEFSCPLRRICYKNFTGIKTEVPGLYLINEIPLANFGLPQAEGFLSKMTSIKEVLSNSKCRKWFTVRSRK
eukprot:GHVP01029917.1.p1 GENE.GHVP01029917.1~~GHVP01029917.1.p1  ORF type:complete len:145 (+),score=9.72 GHVP01029917.1:1415-1849(+)